MTLDLLMVSYDTIIRNKRKINWTSLKNKNFCAAKDTIKEVNRQLTEL
jgi:hypothetical protein